MDVAVLNRGTLTAGRTQVLFLHSADRTITTADAVIGSEFTDTTLYFGACVDLPDLPQLLRDG